MTDVSQYLNDGELNYLADLFLASIGFDIKASDYRTLRNAVVLSVFGLMPTSDIWVSLCIVSDTPAEEVKRTAQNAVNALGRSFKEAYSAVYAPDNGLCVYPVPVGNGIDEVVGFLGTALAYIISANYPALSDRIKFALIYKK